MGRAIASPSLFLCDGVSYVPDPDSINQRMSKKNNMSDQNSFHEDYRKPNDVSASSDRTFGLVFAVAFSALGLWPTISGGYIRWWAISIAALFLIASLFKPKLLFPLNQLWTKFGLLLHKITNPIIMGFIFFFVVTPIGLIMRLMGKCPLDLEFDQNLASYWVEREPPGPPPETMRNQF